MKRRTQHYIRVHTTHTHTHKGKSTPYTRISLHPYSRTLLRLSKCAYLLLIDTLLYAHLLSLHRRVFRPAFGQLSAQPPPSLVHPVGFTLFYGVYTNGTAAEKTLVRVDYLLTLQQYNTIGTWMEYVVAEHLKFSFSLESGAGLFVKQRFCTSDVRCVCAVRRAACV
jgi:hypothetical protein